MGKEKKTEILPTEVGLDNMFNLVDSGVDWACCPTECYRGVQSSGWKVIHLF